MGIAVSSKPRPPRSTWRKDDDRLWWLAPMTGPGGNSQVARRLESWMNTIESASWSQRWADLTYYRYMTGRSGGPVAYNFSATARPSSLTRLWGRATFSSPKYNLLAQCSEALHARVYSHRPFLFVCPIDGDFKARVKSKKLTRFLDAAFFDLNLWSIIEQMGSDCRIWGSAFLKVDVSQDKKRIEVTRILRDEVVVDDNELNTGSEPLHVGIRLFVNRDVMLSRFGADPAARDAIMRAPKSQNGCYLGSDLDTTDVIVLREAWARKVGDVPGRHVLSVGSYAFVDEPYDRDHTPLARMVFNDQGTGYFGQGMPEMVLGLVRSLDFQLAAVDENHRRASWPRIGIAAGSNVNPSALGDTSNGIFTFAKTPPVFITPNAVTAGQYQYISQLIGMIKERFRLNDQVVSGKRPKFTSGAAIEKEDEVNDAAHVDLFQHLEDCVEQIGVRLIEAAEIAKPVVRLPGRYVQEIDWKDVQIERSSYYLRVFKLSQLSQSGAEKQAQIDRWYAEGAISKATKMRLEQVPDIDGYQNLANASLDFIEWSLDKIVEDDDYTPPEPWIDLQAASEIAQSRYLLEQMHGTPRARLNGILRWMAQVQEMIEDMAPPAPPAAPGAPGLPPGPGAPPGLPPGGPAPFGIQPPAGVPMTLAGKPAPQMPFPIGPGAAPPPAIAPPA